MRLYSDFMTMMYPQCILSKETGILTPKNDTPTINFNYLKELLLSKDLSRVHELLNEVELSLNGLDDMH